MTGLTCSSTKHNIKLILSLFNLCTKTSVRENALRSLLPSMDSACPAMHPAIRAEQTRISARLVARTIQKVNDMCSIVAALRSAQSGL